LDPHGTNETAVEDLKVLILVIQQFDFVYEAAQGDRGAGFAAADHGVVEHKQRVADGALLHVEGLLDSLDELDLALVGVDVEGGEVGVVDGVVHQFGVVDDDLLVGVLVEVLESLYAHLEVEDEGGGDLHNWGLLLLVLAGEVEAFPSVPVVDADNLEEGVDELEGFRFIDILFFLIFADVVGDIEKGDKFELYLFLSEPEIFL
jgi:hypothetical protein